MPKMTDLGSPKPPKMIPKSNKKATKHRYKKRSANVPKYDEHNTLQISKHITKTNGKSTKTQNHIYAFRNDLCTKNAPPKRSKTRKTTNKKQRKQRIETKQRKRAANTPLSPPRTRGGIKGKGLPFRLRLRYRFRFNRLRCRLRSISRSIDFEVYRLI